MRGFCAFSLPPWFVYRGDLTPRHVAKIVPVLRQKTRNRANNKATQPMRQQLLSQHWNIKIRAAARATSSFSLQQFSQSRSWTAAYYSRRGIIGGIIFYSASVPSLSLSFPSLFCDSHRRRNSDEILSKDTKRKSFLWPTGFASGTSIRDKKAEVVEWNGDTFAE